MWDAIAAEIWAYLKGEGGMILSAPASFIFSVLACVTIIALVLSRIFAANGRREMAIKTATIELQGKMLEESRHKEDRAKKTIEEIRRKPELRLKFLGANVFVPDGETQWTGILVHARIWNTGAPSFVVRWSLSILPKGRVPTVAQYTNPPDQITIGGPKNSYVYRSTNSLDLKTIAAPVEAIPLDGEVLFYTTLPKPLVVDSATWIEVTVQDIFQQETVLRHRMGDSLGR